MSKLLVDDVHVYYGTSHILQGVSMRVEPGEAVAYIGGNGAGKTTTFRAILGLVSLAEGTVQYDDETLDGPTHERVSRGIGYVPGDRRIFGPLTVRENLLAAHTNDAVEWSERLDAVYEVFPALEDRPSTPADALSGGQQQMLAIGRALMNDPDLLLLDEPTEGLAPSLVDDVIEALDAILAEGHTMVIIEHNLPVAFAVCDRGYVLQRGRIAFEGTIDEIEANAGEASGIGGTGQ